MEHVASLLARYPANEEHEDAWGESRLLVGEHIVPELPPDELVTPVRAVVLVGAQVLVVHDPHALHILPGGRREPGETLLATLRREVLEETGWW